MTLDEPLYYVNSTRILACMGLHFYLTFTHSLSGRQFFGTVTGEKFSVDIDNRATIVPWINFILFSSFYLLIILLFFVLVILPYFICAVTWSRLHTCDFRKAIIVHAKTRSQGITSIRS